MRLTQSLHIELSDHRSVTVTPRRNARNVTLRQNGAGELRASVPYGMPLQHAVSSIGTLLTRLPIRTATEPTYSTGDIIECGDTRFHIHTPTYRPDKVVVTRHGLEIGIGVGDRLDITSIATHRAISGSLCRAAFAIARQSIIPQAIEIARRTGVTPTRWDIGRGKRTLGTCHADRHITLSCLLVFLPPHLREYIICHELAHLTEMNHSNQFHKLCDTYCQGMEQMWNKELKHFKWPVLR